MGVADRELGAQDFAAQAAPDASDAAQIRLLLENVEKSFDTYRRAESRFLDLVIERGGGKQSP